MHTCWALSTLTCRGTQFKQGLDSYIGFPSPNVEIAIRIEHTQSSDSTADFVAPNNKDLITTPAKEYWLVLSDLKAYPGQTPCSCAVQCLVLTKQMWVQAIGEEAQCTASSNTRAPSVQASRSSKSSRCGSTRVRHLRSLCTVVIDSSQFPCLSPAFRVRETRCR